MLSTLVGADEPERGSTWTGGPWVSVSTTTTGSVSGVNMTVAFGFAPQPEPGPLRVQSERVDQPRGLN